MRAAGPLYPLVCALASSSALPLFDTLSPTREDRIRAAPWLVATGLALGVAAAALAVVSSRIAMAPAVGATVAVVSLIVILGGYREDRAARFLTSVPAGAAAIASAVVLLRLALLWGIGAGDWVGAFVASQIAGLWAGLFAAYVAALLRDEPDDENAGDEVMAATSAKAIFVAGAAGIVVSALIGGLAGLVGAILASAFAAAIGYVGRNRELAATEGSIQLGGELVCLVAFAALSSAEMSPWVGY